MVQKESKQKPKPTKKRTKRAASDTVRIAITLPGPGDMAGPVKFSGDIASTDLKKLLPPEKNFEQAIKKLAGMGFEVTGHGKYSINARCSRKLYEQVFGTKLSRFKQPFEEGVIRQANAFFFPGEKAPWQPESDLSSMIDDAYIQWPHIYMNSRFTGQTSALPPSVNYHHLRVPGDVAMLVNADSAHRRGITGEGIKVAMIDSGFAHGHAYFDEREYRVQTVLAPGATDADEDGNSHGTGESANLLAVAPDVEFTGVKLDNEIEPGTGATILEGLQTAMQHNPQIISVSMGYDMCPSDQDGNRISNMHLTSLPNSLKALEVEIRAIADAGTIVVFSAGNGHVGFPGMMPEVLSVGGVYVDQLGAMRASDYASAFTSKIYPGRIVPDICGLVGLASNSARYIMLPVQPGSKMDKAHDRTKKDDGWAVFSGTSAAAPQLAGVCALLLQKNPGLTSADIKSVLAQSARDVIHGTSNAASNENDGPLAAGPGHDPATGPGLVDVEAALEQV